MAAFAKAIQMFFFGKSERLFWPVDSSLRLSRVGLPGVTGVLGSPEPHLVVLRALEW